VLEPISPLSLKGAEFLGGGAAGAGLGVTVFGHTMSFVEEMAMVAALGVVLVTAAIWAFGRRE
jgi:hypothetical protein